MNKIEAIGKCSYDYNYHDGKPIIEQLDIQQEKYMEWSYE